MFKFSEINVIIQVLSSIEHIAQSFTGAENDFRKQSNSSLGLTVEEVNIGTNLSVMQQCEKLALLSTSVADNIERTRAATNEMLDIASVLQTEMRLFIEAPMV